MNPAVGGPVVVGVSPSTGSPSALRWAATEAAQRRLDLVAVMAWRPSRPPTAPAGRPPAVSAESSDQAREAEEVLRGHVVQALGNDFRVTCRALRGSAMAALLGAAEDASMLVIGEPQRGRLGSVRTSLLAPQIVLKARCPVVVMPAETVLVTA